MGGFAVAGDQWIMNGELCFRDKVDKTVDGGGLSFHDSVVIRVALYTKSDCSCKTILQNVLHSICVFFFSHRL